MANDKPLVLVVGATGTTGRSIVKGLLAAGNYRVTAIVRPASLSKPQTEELRASGVEIRTGDLNDGVESLKKMLEGVDVLISAVVAWAIEEQKDIIRAAKEVGVQRVVPCDFGTPGAKGVRALHDSKLAIREFIKELDVPHTFIDVGWWEQLYLPLPLRSNAPQPYKEMSRRVLGKGEAKNLVTSSARIGVYVARIVGDVRTLNSAVIIWEDELTQNAAHEIGERLSGEGERLKAARIITTPEDCLNWAQAAKEALKKDPDSFAAHFQESLNEYQYSMQVLHENTLENAKALGYLDVRELYPDIKPLSLEEYAKEFYALEEPASVYAKS